MTQQEPAVLGRAPRARTVLTSPETALLLLLAAGAWAGTLLAARGMAGMPATMGLELALFVPAWTLMMAAMMLPAVSPLASLYGRTLRSRRPLRLAGLVSGYLAVWAAAGVPAYGFAWLATWLAGHHPGAAHALAIAVFAGCGVYQLSSLKDRCLAKCRSPLGQLMRYGSYRGRFRDVRVGAHHGAYCLACCWALMAVLIVVGVMNVLAMIGLACLILVEKVWIGGPVAGRLAGAAALVLAVVTVWVPGLAPGLAPHMMHTMMMGQG